MEVLEFQSNGCVGERVRWCHTYQVSPVGNNNKNNLQLKVLGKLNKITLSNQVKKINKQINKQDEYFSYP